jgi:hypothetical protein
VVWTCAKNLAPTGIRSPDRPACNQSLYRQLPGPFEGRSDINKLLFLEFFHVSAEVWGRTFTTLTPKDLQRRRAVSPLKIKIPSKNLGRQRFPEGFNSGVKELSISGRN